MKVTKYPQSCLLLEEDESSVVIDPGAVFTKKYSVEELGELDAVLFTHKHSDHIDTSAVQSFRENGVAMYGNESVRDLAGEDINLVENSLEFSVGKFNIIPLDLPHCVMTDGSEGPPNTGYLVNENLFHPGDGVEIDGLEVEVLATPVAGPSVSIKQAIDFIKQVGAEVAIPIHYDVFKEDPSMLEKFAPDNVRIVVLGDGESTEI